METPQLSFILGNHLLNHALALVLFSSFGDNGFKIRGQLVIPIRSPRGALLGFEARSEKEDGSKRVLQYGTNNAQWNPYFLGAEKAFKTLWEGGDLWVVEEYL